MTIATQSALAGPFTGNGSTTVFAFSFKCFDQGDLQVIREESGAQTVLTITTDYTVSLNSDQEASPGGNVTMVTAPTATQTVFILSDVNYTQEAAFTNAGGFYPTVLNDARDRTTLQIQQLNDKIARAPLVPVGDTPSSDLLDAVEAAVDDIDAIKAAPAAAATATAKAQEASDDANATAADRIAVAADRVTTEAARDDVQGAVSLTDNVQWFGSTVLDDGTRAEFGVIDDSNRMKWFSEELTGQLYQGNGTTTEKVRTQAEEDAATIAALDGRIFIGSDRVTDDGTRWKISFAGEDGRIVGGMVETSPDVYEWRLATPAGIKTVGSTGGSESINYADDASSNDFVRTDDNYILIVSIDGTQSNGDGINPDTGDAINYDEPESDGSEDWVLMPSVGTRPEGQSFTELVSMFEDGVKANCRESSLSSICYSLHKRLHTLHSQRVRIAGMVIAQTAQTIEELSRGSDYYDNFIAAHEDMAAICQANGWKPEVIRVRVQGEANNGDKALAYMQKLETDRRQRTDDLRRIYGIQSDILEVQVQTNAGQTRDPDDSDWAPKEPPLANAILPQRVDWARCAGPIFQFEHSSDDLHLSCDGQVHMGVMVQNVIYEELFSHGWQDWEMVRAVWTSSTVCDVHMQGPDTDLALNGDSIIDMTGSTTTTSGFQAHDYAGNLASISSVAIAADKATDDVIVRFTFGSAVTSNLWIEMGRRKDGSGSNGPDNGGRHILRTTRTLTCPKTSATIYERAPSMQFFIGRP